MSVGEHESGLIERAFHDELAPHDEARLRAHLAVCDACRAAHDRETALFRALAGAPGLATKREDAAIARRVLAQVRGDARVAVAERPGRGASGRLSLVSIGVAAAAIAVFVVVGNVPGARDAGGGGVAIVSGPAGTVVNASHAFIDGKPAAVGDIVLDGAHFEVKADGVAELSLVRGGTLRAFPGAAVTLGPRGEQVALETGKVWCLVDAGRGPFEVTTAHGSARVLGTAFFVSTNEKRADVRVVEGRVQVSDHARRTRVEVAAGQRNHVERGGVPSAPMRYDAHTDVDEWQRFWGAFFKGIERSLKEIERALLQGR